MENSSSVQYNNLVVGTLCRHCQRDRRRSVHTHLHCGSGCVCSGARTSKMTQYFSNHKHWHRWYQCFPIRRRNTYLKIAIFSFAKAMLKRVSVSSNWIAFIILCEILNFQVCLFYFGWVFLFCSSLSFFSSHSSFDSLCFGFLSFSFPFLLRHFETSFPFQTVRQCILNVEMCLVTN